MIRFWKKRLENSIVTEDLERDEEMAVLRKKLKDGVHAKFAGSLAIRMVSAGSCNACEAECNAMSNPYYDLERLGIYFVASPRHADVMMLSGVMTANMLPHALDAYEQIPNPKWVITLGDCPAMQSPIEPSFAIKGPSAQHLPITHHIEGCPPNPRQIIKGLVQFIESLN